MRPKPCSGLAKPLEMQEFQKPLILRVTQQSNEVSVWKDNIFAQVSGYKRQPQLQEVVDVRRLLFTSNSSSNGDATHRTVSVWPQEGFRW